MKSIFLGLGCLLFFNIVSAQSAPGDFLVGTWKIVNAKASATYLPPDSFIMEKVSRAFEASELIFNVNNQFIFQSPTSDLQIQNAHWQYFPNTGIIEIGEWNRTHLPLLHKLLVEKNAEGQYVITFTDMGVELIVSKMPAGPQKQNEKPDNNIPVSR